jgi:hypothetical protein
MKFVYVLLLSILPFLTNAQEYISTVFQVMGLKTVELTQKVSIIRPTYINHKLSGLNILCSGSRSFIVINKKIKVDNDGILQFHVYQAREVKHNKDIKVIICYKKGTIVSFGIQEDTSILILYLTFFEKSFI